MGNVNLKERMPVLKWLMSSILISFGIMIVLGLFAGVAYSVFELNNGWAAAAYGWALIVAVVFAIHYVAHVSKD